MRHPPEAPADEGGTDAVNHAGGGGNSFLGQLSLRLTGEEPEMPTPGQGAGVAVIFRDNSGAGEEILLIRRAERDGDPWSGHVAFPGGMVSAKDRSFEETARRETIEEVGIDLSSNGAAFLGYMRETKARVREVVVVPSVFKMAADSAVTLSDEVASYEWVPLRELASKEAGSTYHLRRGDKDISFPSLVYRGLVIWGLTERILSAIIRGGAGAREEGGDGDRVRGEVERV